MQEKDKQAALRYLTVRMRSEHEMRQYLLKRSVPEEEIDEIIAYLYSYHYLDDAAFAASFVRDKCRFHPCGRMRLVHDLREKGIDGFVIEDVLAEEFPPEAEQAQLIREYEKCQQKGKSYQQSMRYLYGKGYSADALSSLERY